MCGGMSDGIAEFASFVSMGIFFPSFRDSRGLHAEERRKPKICQRMGWSRLCLGPSRYRPSVGKLREGIAPYRSSRINCDPFLFCAPNPRPCQEGEPGTSIARGTVVAPVNGTAQVSVNNEV